MVGRQGRQVVGHRKAGPDTIDPNATFAQCNAALRTEPTTFADTDDWSEF